MKLGSRWIRLTVILLLFIGGLALIWLLFRPIWLTQTYGQELKDAVQKYQQTLGTIAGWRDPAVMAHVATGDYLNYLIQVQCTDCVSVQVATKVGVEILRVLDYSPTLSKALARVEWGWHKVSAQTGETLGSCHAQAFTSIYVLTREDGVWKISGGEDTDRDPVDDSPELLKKYCGAN